MVATLSATTTRPLAARGQAPPLISAVRWRAGYAAAALLAAFCLAAYATLLLPGPWARQYVAAGDFSQQFFAFQSYAAARLSQGQLPLWDPYILGGQAHLADPQTALFYPLGLAINLLFGHNGLPYAALEWRAALDTILGAWFASLLVGRLARSHVAGIVGGVVFAFGGYLASYPLPQLPVLEASVWLPLALYLLERALTGRGAPAAAWFALAGLAGAILLLAGHDQTAMLAAYATAAYAGTRWVALRRPLLPTAGGLALAAAIAAGLSAPQWLTALAYLPVTNRVALSYVAASGGFAWRDFGQLLLPGGYFLRSYYVGVLPLLLALLALHDRRHWGWLALWIAAALLALGRNGPLYPLLYGRLPGLAAFEDQERAAYLAAFAQAVLAGLGAGMVLRRATPVIAIAAPRRDVGQRRLGQLWRVGWAGFSPRGRASRQGGAPSRASGAAAAPLPPRLSTFLSALIVAVALALTVGGAALLREYAPPASDPALAAPLAVNALAAALLGAAALLTLLSVRWRVIGQRGAAGLLVLLPVVNLLGANASLGRTTVNPVPTLPYQAAAFLHAQPGLWRVDTLRDDELPRNAGAILNLSFPRGDDPLVIRRSATLASQSDRYKVWQLFNIQYVLSRQEPGTGFRQVARLDGFNVFRMLYPLPRAWVASDVHLAASPAQALSATMALAQPGTTVVLEQAPPIAFRAMTPLVQRVDLVAAAPERLEWRLSLSSAAAFVISEPFAPGWTATVDGKPTALFPADYGLVALAAPAGAHTVALRYRPAGLVPGALAAVGAAALLLGALVGPVTLRRARRRG